MREGSKVRRLRRQMASLQRRLGVLEGGRWRRTSNRPSGRETLAAEIEELEKQLTSGIYMEEDIVDPDIDEDVEVEDLDEDLDEVFMDDDLEFEEEDVFASEDKKGIDDEITQDYLSDVEAEEGVEQLTEGAPSDIAASNLHEAARRLDRLANYCEKHNEVKLAFQIDQLADRVDAQITTNEEGK